MRRFIIGIAVFVIATQLYGQRVGFISSDVIRKKFPEAMQAEQRIQSIVEDWKRELTGMQQKIDDIKFEISKNRLVWSDEERIKKEQELKVAIEAKEAFAKVKFQPEGEYDAVVKQVMQPVESKIYAAVQEVAADNKFDIIWDTSIQPLVSANYKYDLTVKVLKSLGVDVAKLEAELKENIEKDLRNTKKKSRRPSSGEVKETENQPENQEAQDKEPNSDDEPDESRQRKVQRVKKQ